MTYTELQQKGFEIAKQHEALPLDERLGLIARTFGCKQARVETSDCGGKWQGYTDIYIVFDNGLNIGIGNCPTPQAKSADTVNGFVNDTLARYHPDIVKEAKERATAAFLECEAADNLIAAKKMLIPYTFLNVELIDGSDNAYAGYMGWYYVTLAVEGKIFGHLESGLASDISCGTVAGRGAIDGYHVAGGLKEDDVDYVLGNVGFSSESGLNKCDISNAARLRAEQALAGRESENGKIAKAAAYIVETSALGTEYGNYITYPRNIPKDIMTVDEFEKLKGKIVYEILGYESVAQADIDDDGSIDLTMYLAYCPNYIPHPEERGEYPDDREILDALQSKFQPEPEKPPLPERKPSLLGKLEQNKQKAAAQAGRSDAGKQKSNGLDV